MFEIENKNPVLQQISIQSQKDIKTPYYITSSKLIVKNYHPAGKMVKTKSTILNKVCSGGISLMIMQKNGIWYNVKLKYTR